MSKTNNTFEELAMDIANQGKDQGSQDQGTGNPDKENINNAGNSQENQLDDDQADENNVGNADSQNDDNAEGDDGQQVDPSPSANEKDDIDEDNDEIIADWDIDLEDEDEKNDQSSLDFSEIAKQVGFEDVKDKDSFIKKVNDLKLELNQNKSQDVLEKLPKDLKDAIKVALEGDGNWKSYIEASQIDYNKYDDDSLLRNYYADAFVADEQGNIDLEGLQDYMDSLSDAQKKVEAKKIRETLVAKQEWDKQQKLNESLQRKQKNDEALKEAITKKDNIHGFKVTDNVKSDLFKKISSGDAMKEMFYDKEGGYNFDNIADVYFIWKNFPKIKKYFETNTRQQVKKEDFHNISNNSVRRGAQKPNPGENPMTAMDVWLQDIKKKQGIQK